MVLLLLLILVVHQCSPFLSEQQVKEFFKLLKHLQASSLIMSSQRSICNRNSSHFSPLDTDSLALTSLWIQESEYGMNINIFPFMGRIFNNSRGLFLKSPETFRAYFGWHNSLCIFKTKASRGTKLCSCFCFYSLYNIWKDQLYRISRSYFYKWLFGPATFSGLLRNRAQVILGSNKTC